MTRKYVFVDEAGNFDFSPRGSRYFILSSVTLDDCTVGDELLALRRELVWRGSELTDAFHATDDKQAVRDEVFKLLSNYDFRIDSTIFEKAKAYPHLQREDRFYELAWYLHMKHVTPRIATPQDELLVVSASVATKKRQQLLGTAMAGVMAQMARTAFARTTYWPAASDPCLQVADYCCWAIQRKWERDDHRSYILVEAKIRTEFDVFRLGSQKAY